ncbi:Jerky protein-like [Gracilariopsis chorda]|uniref:Jerky protein-like n=1 Tax=Gracilariopsis chorda TaxID=448386 RepID=A0A2V3IYZ3_9FLOR|nr:Jerky protein-like [Gracilariopsis chorda]|eukprot:PXF47319.1 Jerky protein-like [Gracilariopsis chorda]
MDPVLTLQKQTRTRLNIAQKLRILHLLKDGHSTTAIMWQFNIASRTVRNIEAQGTALLQAADTNHDSLSLKVVQPVLVPKLEQELLAFLSYALSAKMPVTQNVLPIRACMIRDAMLKLPTTEKDARVLQKFAASRGWVEKFVNRHELWSVALHGEAVQVQAHQVAEDIRTLRQKLIKFDEDNIYNVDETGRFYKLLPRRTYVGTF